MARTRGGGVTSGMSTQPRRNAGKARATGATTEESQPVVLSAQSPGASCDLDTVAGTRRKSNIFDRRTSEGWTLAPTLKGGGKKLLKSDGSQNLNRGPFAPDTLEEGEDEAQDDILGKLFDEAIGEEQMAGDTSITPQRGSRPVSAVRKSPLSPPKIPVWRMLYVDPDVVDPKLVAGLLEKATSRALRCACTFDVATDIVEALADVRGDTMWVYRGVFINESLYRHKRSTYGRGPDTSIQGKHLSQFLRQVGMSSTRIVLLVAGDVKFDTADAAAHGLSAVLRKPFTNDGFCDILRGMYLNDPPKITPLPPTPTPLQPQPSAPFPCPRCDSNPLLAPLSKHQCLANGIAPLAPPSGQPADSNAAAAATVSAAAAIHSGTRVLPPSAYPSCLGFTPFPQSFINRYHLVSGYVRPEVVEPRRKYTKIAPREDDETGAVPLKGSHGPNPNSTVEDQTGPQLSGSGLSSPGKGEDASGLFAPKYSPTAQGFLAARDEEVSAYNTSDGVTGVTEATYWKGSCEKLSSMMDEL